MAINEIPVVDDVVYGDERVFLVLVIGVESVSKAGLQSAHILYRVFLRKWQFASAIQR